MIPQQPSHEYNVQMRFMLSDSELLPSNTVSTPMSPGMTDSGIYKIIKVVNSGEIGM